MFHLTLLFAIALFVTVAAALVVADLLIVFVSGTEVKTGTVGCWSCVRVFAVPGEDGSFIATCDTGTDSMRAVGVVLALLITP